MTPSQAYRAALEAAAKVADRQYEAYLKAANKSESEMMACRFDQKSDACTMLAAAIRALPVPEDVGGFRITQKANPTADIIARGMKELNDAGGMVLVPREPTETMLEAANREWDGRMSARSAGVWMAMIEAYAKE